MKRIPIDAAKPGMKLAKAATNAAGQLVLAEGTELTAPLIARLQNLGLTSFHVEAVGDSGDFAVPLANLEQALDRRFRKAQNDPILTQIREAARRHLHAVHGSTGH